MQTEAAPRSAVGAFMARFFAALQYREFRQLWFANTFAQAAAWGLIVARGWLIFEESQSSLLVGLATFAALGPQFLVPPIVGVMADRMDKRKLLSWAYAVNTGQALVFFALALSGSLQIWMLVGLSFVNGTARAAQMPVTQALSASLVPKEKLLNALSLSASVQQGSRLIGPGLVTPVMSLFGPAAALGLCAAFYVIGWFFILLLKPRPPQEDASRESYLTNFVGGLKYVYARPVLRFMLVLVFLHCGLTMAFESLLPTFSHEHLTLDPSGFGTLMMGVGTGAFIASIFVSGIQTSKARGNMMISMGLLSGLGQVMLAMTGDLYVAFVAAAVMGGAQAAFMTMGQAVTQSIAADEFRGRVASINSFSLGGIMAIMNLLNASLAQSLDSEVVLLAEGMIFASVIIVSLSFITGRRVYGRGQPIDAPIAVPA
jgi:MFS family permease